MKTFKELRQYGMELFKTISDVQAENEKRLSKLREMRVYSPEYLAQNQKKADEEFQKTVKLISSQFAEAVKETVENKRTALNQMLTVPPTTEQLNILNSIQFQGKNISESEIQSIAVQLTGNYRCLHSLEAIAQQAGIKLHIPAQYDFQQLNDALNHAAGYLRERVHDLATYNGQSRNWTFDSKCFFGVWEGTEDQPVPFYGDDALILDGNEQTTPVPTVEKRTLTDAEIRVIEALFSNMDPGMAMAQVLASPELRSLVSIHPEYGKMLK